MCLNELRVCCTISKNTKPYPSVHSIKKIVNSLSLVLSSSTPLMESASRDDSRLVGVKPCVIAGITTLQVTRRPVITRLLQFGLIESIAFHTNHLLKQSACELLIWMSHDSNLSHWSSITQQTLALINADGGFLSVTTPDIHCDKDINRLPQKPTD